MYEQTVNTSRSDPTSTQVLVVTAGVYLLMFFYAVSLTMIGPLMPELVDFYRLHLAQGGLIVSAQSLGGVLAILAGSVIADRLPKGGLLAGAFLLYSIVLLLLSTGPAYSLLLLLFFFLGSSTRLVDTMNNAFIADLYPERRGVMLNLLHTCFGFGALLGPIFVRFVLARAIPWPAAYAWLGIACIGAFLLFLLLLRSLPHQSGQRTASDSYPTRALFGSRRMWLLCGMMFCYVGHQSGLIAWLPMYLQDYVGASPFFGSVALSVFWGGIIAGRLLCTLLDSRLRCETVWLQGSAASGAAMLVGLASGVPSLILAAVGLAGLLLGPVIPLLVHRACTLFPHNSGTASAMIFLSGTAAMMVFPWFIGWVAEWASFLPAIAVTAVVLFLLALLAWVMNSQRGNPMDPRQAV